MPNGYDVGSAFYSGQQKAQSAMPAATPQLIVEQQMSALQNEFKQREQRLSDQYNSGMVDQDGYVKTIQKMQAEFDDQFFGLQNKQQQLQQLDAMANIGAMQPDQAGEASWRSVLPDDVARTMFPTQRAEPQPLSPGQLKSAGESVKDYTEAAPTNTHWYLPQRWESQTKEGLINQYKAWREYVGYNAQTPTRQTQLDKVWDKHATDYKFWDAKDPQITALRSKGRLSKAYGKRMGGTPTDTRGMSNPLQQAITAELKKKAPTAAQSTERVTVLSPDGVRGQIPASQLDEALKAGYRRAQ